MKKLFTFFFIVALLPLRAGAMVDSDVWSYVFHLEYSQGTLGVSRDVKFPYSPIPSEFIPEYSSDKTDFYGIIYNIKNKEEARFGFMAPTSLNTASGKTALEVAAPKFADADHVAFFTKTNKHLFDVSVKDSSFCNDNNKCDTAVGEDYKNCPIDCPVPANILPEPIEPVMTPAPLPTTPEPSIVTSPPSNEYTTSTDVSYLTTSTKATATVKRMVDMKTFLSFFGGILFLVLAFVFYRRKKKTGVL